MKIRSHRRASFAASLAGFFQLSACLVLFLTAVANPYAGAQEPSGFGPIDPAPPTGMTPQQVIDKFGARESLFATARDAYTFRQSVKVQTIDDDTNKVDGEYQQVTDIVFGQDGRRAEHVVFAPQSTLERIMMTKEDVQDIEHGFPFVLTSQDLGQYDITYVGRQHVDEIDTYVFDAKPKIIEKNQRYFQGRVWVDQQDFQIALVNGKIVPDDTRRGHENYSPPFTTYYAQVDGKYWFPIYTKAEGVIHTPAGNGYLADAVHIRTYIKYSDYKQFHTSARIIYDGQDITDNKAPDAKTPDTGKQPQTPPK